MSTLLAPLPQGEASRWQELRPYLVSSPKRGVIGSSRYAKRLRSQILAASKAASRSVTCLTKIYHTPVTLVSAPTRVMHVSICDKVLPMQEACVHLW